MTLAQEPTRQSRNSFHGETRDIRLSRTRKSGGI